MSVSNCSNGILNEQIRLCYFPAKVQTGKSSVVTFSKNGKIGFCDIASDDNYIYLLYSGRVRGEAGAKANHCQHILVYDWNGKPIKHILLEKPLFSMKYNASLNRIYGIGYEPEGCILEYDLNEK